MGSSALMQISKFLIDVQSVDSPFLLFHGLHETAGHHNPLPNSATLEECPETIPLVIKPPVVTPEDQPNIPKNTTDEVEFSKVPIAKPITKRRRRTKKVRRRCKANKWTDVSCLDFSVVADLFFRRRASIYAS